MIVKNEEAHLPACIACVADLVDEMVVIDTGSTDGTRDVARSLGAKVFDFPWRDGFAAARNESLDRAMGDWIFWVDADDRIDEPNRERLRSLFANLPNDNVAFLMRYVALNEGAPGRTSAVDHAKLFRRLPQIRWEYRVHEQILPSVLQAGGKVESTDVAIYHLGYQDANVVRGKLERNRRLIELDAVEHPDHPVVLFNLGRTYLRLDLVGESVPPLSRCLQTLPAELAAVRRTAYTLLIEAYCRLRQGEPALAVCLEGRAQFPDDPELLFAEGLVRRNVGDRAGAQACLLQLLEREPDHAGARFHLSRL
jgi:hypothetical protein